jgi:hypothetical protein
MAEYADRKINLKRQGAGNFAVHLRLSLPETDANLTGTAEGHRFALDERALDGMT